MLISLQQQRLGYRPILPNILKDLRRAVWKKGTSQRAAPLQEEIQRQFPQTRGKSLVVLQQGDLAPHRPLRVAVVLSGGQAAGGHNVICGLFDALKELHSQSHLFGFLGGPGGIIEGKWRELEGELLAQYRNQGGFELIGSGRTKIQSQEQLAAALRTVGELDLDGLVIIGGDDSNTNAAFLAEYFLAEGCRTAVVGVPKTIDGDLRNEHVAISFGFDTACKTYAEMIGNIARDALSAKKYYHFIKLMGRSASHIALECALWTHPNCVLIGEEVRSLHKTLGQIVAELADLICLRAKQGKNYGVILIPEGLIEFIPEIGSLIAELNAGTGSQLSVAARRCLEGLPQEIQRQMLLERDPHGNVQLSQIETEKLLIEMVGQELKKRAGEGAYQGKFHPLAHFFGYEGRAAFPTNFDSNYCHALGYAAALLVDGGLSGYMSAITQLNQPAAEWGVAGVPLTALLHLELRQAISKPVIKKSLVDLEGAMFQMAARERGKWALEDLYSYPGPIQFGGDPALTDCISWILKLSS